MMERISRMKPRTIASSPEMSITAIKTISSSVIGMVCWSRSLACHSDEVQWTGLEDPRPLGLYSRSGRFRHPALLTVDQGPTAERKRALPAKILCCLDYSLSYFFFFFQAEDGIRDGTVTGVQTWLF